jgi:hypothetical protein
MTKQQDDAALKIQGSNFKRMSYNALFDFRCRVVDPDPYVFRPPGSGSFHNQAKKVRKS